jgi:hypothetical protein
MRGLTGASALSGSSLRAGLTYAPERRAVASEVDMAVYAAGGIGQRGTLDRRSCDFNIARLQVNNSVQLWSEDIPVQL